MQLPLPQPLPQPPPRRLSPPCSWQPQWQTWKNSYLWNCIDKRDERYPNTHFEARESRMQVGALHWGKNRQVWSRKTLLGGSPITVHAVFVVNNRLPCVSARLPFRVPNSHVMSQTMAPSYLAPLVLVGRGGKMHRRCTFTCSVPKASPKNTPTLTQSLTGGRFKSLASLRYQILSIKYKVGSS